MQDVQLGDQLPEATRQVDALLEAGVPERHERDHVDRADAWMRSLVLAHVDQLECAPDSGGGGLHHRLRAAGEGDDAAVVRLVARVIEQGHAIDLTDGVHDLGEHLRPSSLREVRDAFDQARHVAILLPTGCQPARCTLPGMLWLHGGMAVPVGNSA